MNHDATSKTKCETWMGENAKIAEMGAKRVTTPEWKQYPERKKKVKKGTHFGFRQILSDSPLRRSWKFRTFYNFWWFGFWWEGSGKQAKEEWMKGSKEELWSLS